MDEVKSITRQEFIEKCKAKKTPVKKALISVQMTVEEKNRLKKNAAELGLKLSDYVKCKLFYE